MTDFEFDPQKSRANKTKHGIDFTHAQRLWRDENRLVVPARTVDEPRFMLIAIYRGKCWSALYTMRADHVRIISVRRARKEEQAIYESHGSR